MLTEKIRKYVEEKTGVILSDDFEKRYSKHESNYLKTFKQLDGVIRLYKLWKPYIVEEDQAKLLTNLILTFVKIQCCVVASEAGQNAYLGNYAEVNSDVELPAYWVAQCNERGVTTISKGWGSGVEYF